jgi:hypothetical protein
MIRFNMNLLHICRFFRRVAFRKLLLLWATWRLLPDPFFKAACHLCRLMG